MKIGNWEFVKAFGEQLKCHEYFLVILSIKHLCELQKFISILVQGQILFIALFYNAFCRPGYASVRTLAHFEYLTL